VLQQQCQYLKWLFLQLYLEPISAELATLQVKFEYTEANDPGCFAAGHVPTPPGRIV
jgi:hypothetical protein